MSVDGLDERASVHRLGHEVICSRGQTLGALFAVVAGGEHDDSHIVALRTQNPNRVAPIHPRKEHIHQHDIVRSAGFGRARNLAQAVLRGVGSVVRPTVRVRTTRG